MPYISQSRRLRMRHTLPVTDDIKGVGELNYALTQCCLAYMSSHPSGYQVINDVVGALESCKLEFYRRVAIDLEDLKIEENGDVYP